MFLLKKITKIYRDEIQKLHRVPRKILSNKEPQFASKFIEKFMKALRTMRQLSTAYYPQIDKQIERINQEVGTFYNTTSTINKTIGQNGQQLQNFHIMTKNIQQQDEHYSNLTLKDTYGKKTSWYKWSSQDQNNSLQDYKEVGKKL